MLALLFLMTISSALGDDPTFTVLKKGQTAPFDGRLFNDEAVSKLIVENRYKAEQCNLEIDFHKKRTQAEAKYEYDVLYIKCEADDQRLNNLLEIKKEENEKLEKLIKPSRNSWWMAGGFVAGVLTSIGIMHVVKGDTQ